MFLVLLEIYQYQLFIGSFRGTFERVSLSVLPDGLIWTWTTQGKYLHSFYLSLSLLFLIGETEG